MYNVTTPDITNAAINFKTDSNIWVIYTFRLGT